MSKKETPKSPWRWLVTQMFQENVGFMALLGEELAAKEGITIADLPDEIQISKLTTVHLDPSAMQIRAMPWFMEHFSMVDAVTQVRKDSIPFIAFPTEKMIACFNDAWRKPTEEEVASMKAQIKQAQEEASRRILPASEDMAKGAAAEARFRQSLFQRLRGGSQV